MMCLLNHREAADTEKLAWESSPRPHGRSYAKTDAPPAWVFAGETPGVTAGTAAPLRWALRLVLAAGEKNEARRRPYPPILPLQYHRESAALARVEHREPASLEAFAQSMACPRSRRIKRVGDEDCLRPEDIEQPLGQRFALPGDPADDDVRAEIRIARE